MHAPSASVDSVRQGSTMLSARPGAGSVASPQPDCVNLQCDDGAEAVSAPVYTASSWPDREDVQFGVGAEFVCALPTFSAVLDLSQASGFSWSSDESAVDGATVCHSITAAYCEVVPWQHNLFTVPSGQAGKGFVCELIRLFRAFGETFVLEEVALKAAMLLPTLALQ